MSSDPSSDFETRIQSARSRSGSLLDLLESYKPLLYRIAGQRLTPELRVRSDMSDVVQETMVLATRSFEQYEGESETEFRVWIEGLCRHVVNEAYRKHVVAKKRTVNRERHFEPRPDGSCTGAGEPAAERTTASQHAMRRETGETLRTHLDRLPGLQGEAVRMRYLEQLPVEEIARRLDRSVGAAAGLIKRGIKTLKDMIESESRL